MNSLPRSSMALRRINLLVLALICCLIAALLSILLGAAQISPGELWTALIQGDSTSTVGRIVRHVRLPRTAACLMAGAGLAVSGAILQAVLSNPLAAPNIIGVNAGAALAVTLCSIGTVGSWVISGAAFLGALAAAGLVVVLARATGASRLTVILSGVAINALLNAGSETVRTFYPDALLSSADFRIGGFSSVTTDRLLPAMVLVGVGLILALSLCNEMDVLSLGENTARGLGMSVGLIRPLLLGIAALLAGASVSVCGLLGFVGLIVPHMARRLVGADSRWLVPMSALCGAALVTVCDLVGRLLFAPYELPAGIPLAFLGVPFFLVLLFQQRGGRVHA